MSQVKGKEMGRIYPETTLSGRGEGMWNGKQVERLAYNGTYNGSIHSESTDWTDNLKGIPAGMVSCLSESGTEDPAIDLGQGIYRFGPATLERQVLPCKVLRDEIQKFNSEIYISRPCRRAWGRWL